MRVGFLSDLHIPNNVNIYSEAIDVVVQAYRDAELDKLFLAGDTSNNWKMSLDFVSDLGKEGLDVYTIFGNHEYWSISYNDMQEKEHERYINEKAIDINNDWVVIGLDGMFDHSLVLEVDNFSNWRLSRNKEDLNQIGLGSFDLDRNMVGNYEEVFKKMEESLIKLLENNKEKSIILMTHYVPSDEFILYTEYDDTWNINNAFMGSKRYQELAEQYGVKKVIFGHTHTAHNKTINGVNYHCNPVGYKNWEFSVSFREQVYEKLKVFEL